jgi:hypothetical protein
MDVIALVGISARDRQLSWCHDSAARFSEHWTVQRAAAGKRGVETVNHAHF